MTTDSSSRAARVVWHVAADEHDWIARSVEAIAGALRTALAEPREVRLLMSGGSTPIPVHRALAREALDWSRIIVGLVDDRDVDPDADGSNARLIRETLLLDRAADARFEVLRAEKQSAEAAAEAANARWRYHADSTLAAAVLGMGDDGHTASLFPNAKNLDEALTTREPYAAIDATGCAGAGMFPRRVSLTPVGLAAAKERILLIRGEDKRELFERALEAGDVRELPIRAAIDLPGAPLHVHWCS